MVGRLARVTLLDSLVEGLAHQIESGELAPGTQLPAEASIGEQWGVSRPVVREALALLRDRGFLHTVNGSGTFVRHPDSSYVSAALERHISLAEPDVLTVDHLYEARQAIEVTAARLAATRSDASDLDDLHRSLADMERYRTDPVRYAAADTGFHLAVARSSKNPLLPTLLGPLVRTIVEGMVKSHQAPHAAELGLRGHEHILQCIQRRNAAEAAEAMEKHLRESRGIFPTDVVVHVSST